MPIGNKVGSLKNLKKTLKRGQMGPIRYIPKNGQLTVRFLEEPENWVNYNEHYDATIRKSYPCIEDGCPGCRTEERRTSRYLVNALDVEKDVVIALQLPKDLTNSLVRKYERYDTIMDRDYTLIREGEGLDTTYEAEAEPVMNRKLTKYTLLDLQEELDKVFKSIHDDGDDDDDDDDEDDKPAPKARSMAAKKSAAKKPPKAEVEEDDEDDEDDEPEPPKKRAGKFKPPVREPEEDEDDDEDEDEEEEDDEPEEDEDEDDADEDADDDEFPYDEDDLKGMTIGQLRVIAKEWSLPTAGMNKAELIAALLLEPEDDDED